MNYKKIEIKSESDLPKETGTYFCYSNQDGAFELSVGEFNPKDSSIVSDWIEYCKWYLLPVTEITDEQID